MNSIVFHFMAQTNPRRWDSRVQRQPAASFFLFCASFLVSASFLRKRSVSPVIAAVVAVAVASKEGSETIEPKHYNRCAR